MRFGLMAIALLLAAAPALAQERDYCPARPGLGTPACTIAPGRVSVEMGLVDRTRDENSSERTDAILIGDTLVRIGLTDTIEAQFGWTPFGHVRTRDKLAQSVESTDRVGDVTLGFKANLHHPDGTGFSAAIQPFVTLPTGRSPAGAGDWGAGVVAPVTFDLNGTLNLQFTPEADAAVDQDGNGRHLAYGGTLGLGVKLSNKVSSTIELQAMRDEDPSGGTTASLVSLALAWMPKDDLQIDIGTAAGLDREAPDAEFYAGISRRF
jgi:hypothetical protein